MVFKHSRSLWAHVNQAAHAIGRPAYLGPPTAHALNPSREAPGDIYPPQAPEVRVNSEGNQLETPRENLEHRSAEPTETLSPYAFFPLGALGVPSSFELT